MKKQPSKVAHNRPTFFFNTGPAAQTAEKQKFRTPKSPLMQDWEFRLGHEPSSVRSIFCIFQIEHIPNRAHFKYSTCQQAQEVQTFFLSNSIQVVVEYQLYFSLTVIQTAGFKKKVSYHQKLLTLHIDKGGYGNSSRLNI